MVYNCLISIMGSPSTKLECDKKIAEKQREIAANLRWVSYGCAPNQKREKKEKNAQLRAEIAELRALKKTLPK